MEMVGADFVVTGEVLGQRPFSQVSGKMRLVEKESGLTGKLLRPLSAKLLPPTECEESGLVDRDRLESIRGRGRKRQMQLARKYGLEDYPTPASGCLLTDPAYSRRLTDLIAHTPRLTFNDLNLLRVGRHFRLDDWTKVIVGRNENDNKRLLQYRLPEHHLLEALNVGSPMTLLVGSATTENLKTAAAITARYSSARNQPLVTVTVHDPAEPTELKVHPSRDEELASLAVR
jgi:tRNA U34 2-thiouridine synthase MnmA/TrmU